jgi:hypothetical protein
MNLPEQPTSYLAAVMTLYVQLPETPMRISLYRRA